jgi:hypothetical protein
MTLTTGMTQNGAIRASDADRAKALGLLGEHWLAGRLTIDEYEARCEEAAHGSFLDELRWSLRELPYPLPEHGLAGLTPAAPPATRTPAPPIAPQTNAIISVVFGALAITVAWAPFLFLVTLPVSTCGWWCGRRVRRADRTLVRSDTRVLATVGEILSFVATAMGVLALGACGMLIASF